MSTVPSTFASARMNAASAGPDQIAKNASRSVVSISVSRRSRRNPARHIRQHEAEVLLWPTEAREEGFQIVGIDSAVGVTIPARAVNRNRARATGTAFSTNTNVSPMIPRGRFRLADGGDQRVEDSIPGAHDGQRDIPFHAVPE